MPSPTRPQARDVVDAADIVVVAASAGGITAISKLLEALPQTFRPVVIVVQHRGPHDGILTQIFQRRSTLPVKEAEDGEVLRGNTVYVAPGDRHVRVTSERRVQLCAGPKVRFSRPAGDVLFECAAASFGRNITAVVLTGSDGDGSDGVRHVKAAGGKVIVEDPRTAEVSGMPLSAIATGCVDHVLELSQIAPMLYSLASPN